MSTINDPLTHRGARVTEDGEILSAAISSPAIEFASHEKGLAFTAHSTYAATGGEEVISLQNDNSDMDIIVENIVVSTSVASVIDVFEMTSGTPAGTTVIPHNLNLSSSVVAQATVFGNASVTGSVVGTTIAEHLVDPSSPFDFKFGGSLIIPKNSVIAVTLDTTGVVHANIIFYYAPKLKF